MDTTATPLPPIQSGTPQGLRDEGQGASPAVAVQRSIKVRRDYNSWVASETMEDYALRFTPQRFRKWSELRMANTAFGAASFLILEAMGATLLVKYGFTNVFWAIVAKGLIIFLASLPISIYAARYGMDMDMDMDLLTRGAGFGYIGSTLTSLIYASFIFIFFALEAAVMAYALELAFGIPPCWGYLVCALVVISLVTHGVSTISRLQVWTQGLWLVMLVVPFACVFVHAPGAFSGVVNYAGEKGASGTFNLHLFGAVLTVGIALITQMGEQADQAKSRYISAISHELRTPLNSILGYAQLMGEDAGIPPHRKQAVDVIKRGGEHLLSMIEGTLDIARIEAGKLTLNVRPMPFADCVHEVAGMFELQAAAKGLRFVFNAVGNLPELVRADEQRVRQVLINLLGNAIKFTAEGQVTFRVRHAREMAYIDIQDTGSGMSAAELDNIFEPFARGSTAGQGVGGASGAGLGLTIAKMLTDLMGGEMTVVSTPGTGSVFGIRLFLPEVHLAVRHTELIDWLERTLNLVWCHAAPVANPAPVLAMSAPCVWPDARQLDMVQLGFYRGILNKLADIETQQPATAAFVEEMRVLARQFRFEAIASLLTQTTVKQGERP